MKKRCKMPLEFRPTLDNNLTVVLISLDVSEHYKSSQVSVYRQYAGTKFDL